MSARFFKTPPFPRSISRAEVPFFRTYTLQVSVQTKRSGSSLGAGCVNLPGFWAVLLAAGCAALLTAGCAAANGQLTNASRNANKRWGARRGMRSFPAEGWREGAEEQCNRAEMRNQPPYVTKLLCCNKLREYPE